MSTSDMAIHPGEYIREEMEARGWTVEDLAKNSYIWKEVVQELIDYKTRITRTTALCLAHAFGTSAELWLNLQAAYDAAKGK